MSKKDEVILALFEKCKKRNNFVFHNDEVKIISRKHKFGNPFDATKLDNLSKLPEKLLKKDYCIIHLGSGNHMFIKGINNIYHNFEPIQKEFEWSYKKSILNQFNTSESNILSVANNQRILHNFLFGEDKEYDSIDIEHRPKTYFPHRTKTNLNYYIGNNIERKLEKIQLEIDLTIEFDGTIGVFEAKNGKPDNFNIYQIYHPYLYYYNVSKNPEMKDKIRNIVCVYVVRDNKEKNHNIKLWAYTFTNPIDMTSIKFLKSVSYKLIHKK